MSDQPETLTATPPSNKSKPWQPWAIVLLLVLWGFAEYRCWGAHALINRIHAVHGTISAIDAATGSPLPITVKLAEPDIGRYPQDLVISGSGTTEASVSAVVVEPLFMQVRSPGYLHETVEITNNQNQHIGVRLQKPTGR
ncbi:MAG: hypothetical protein AAGK09_10915 [Planctomycetota bacterium]